VSAYLIIFLASAGTTFAVTPLVRRTVVRIGAVYQPNDRTVHASPTPTMGGVAMYAGFLVAMAIAFVLPFFAEVRRGSPVPLAALVTCTLMFGLGLIDDRRRISALAKFTAQVFIGGVLVLMGAALLYFWIPGLGVVSLSTDVAVLLTILWVALFANAVNLVDGLDGLAAGMIAIAAAAFFIFLVRTPSTFGDASAAALLSAITVGVCLGFLPWNFYPAKIFMGDCGSLLLGMLLAIATIDGFGRNPFQPGGGDIAAVIGVILVPLLVLFIPFLDVVLAVARRTWRGQGIGQADKEHIHHRLMDIGHSHRRAVLLMYLWSGLISASALAVGLIDGRTTVGLVLLAALGLFLVTALPALDRWRTRTNGSADATESPEPAAAGSEPSAEGQA
jgi:UDP-GlcNAc:undecaprenyl-phosphate/decaprenyl-phosphate GlcNAc-1-phosphate transferase